MGKSSLLNALQEGVTARAEVKEVSTATGKGRALGSLTSGRFYDAAEADTAIFYSISNCQKGLRGVSFGNFLIKQVVDDLADGRLDD